MKKPLILVTSIFISRANKIKKILLSNQRGAILVALIFGMVIVAGVGAAMISMNTTTSFNQFGANESMKAYYLAEAGRRYVLQQANAGVDITTISTIPFTLDNGDQFVISDTVFNDFIDFSFTSTGTTVATINREIKYSRTATNLATDGNNSLCNDLAQGFDCADQDSDEPFDNDCENRGYRSRVEGLPGGAGVGGVAYLGYDFQAPVQILRVAFLQDEDDVRNNLNDSVDNILVQGSDFADFSTIGYSSSIRATRSFIPGGASTCGPPPTPQFEVFDFTDNPGAFRYWRLFAQQEPDDGKEWHINELRMFGASATSETQT